MITFLARIFRGLSFMLGITAPPPGENERRFVLVWLGSIGFMVVFSVLVFYAIAKMYVR